MKLMIGGVTLVELADKLKRPPIDMEQIQEDSRAAKNNRIFPEPLPNQYYDERQISDLSKVEMSHSTFPQ